MRISTSKIPPSTKELMHILKQEFSGSYSYNLYELGKEKTVIVKKSASVGAQISIRDNEFTIQRTRPPPVAYFVSFFGTELASMLNIFAIWSSRSHGKEFEKEIALFITRKYT